MMKGKGLPRRKAVAMKVDTGSRGWLTAEKTFIVMVKLAKDTSALENFWRDNRRVLDMLKGEDLAAYNRVLDSFKLRKTEILDAGRMAQDNAGTIQEDTGDTEAGDVSSSD